MVGHRPKCDPPKLWHCLLTVGHIYLQNWHSKQPGKMVPCHDSSHDLSPNLLLAVIYQEVTHHTWPLFAPLGTQVNLGNPGKPISPYLLPLHAWPHRKYRSNNPLGRGPISLFRAHVSLYHGMLVGVMLCCYTSGESLYNCDPHNLPQKTI